MYLFLPKPWSFLRPNLNLGAISSSSCTFFVLLYSWENVHFIIHRYTEYADTVHLFPLSAAPHISDHLCSSQRGTPVQSEGAAAVKGRLRGFEPKNDSQAYSSAEGDERIDPEMWGQADTQEMFTDLQRIDLSTWFVSHGLCFKLLPRDGGTRIQKRSRTHAKNKCPKGPGQR